MQTRSFASAPAPAESNGVRFGRPRKLNTEQRALAYALLREGRSVGEVAKTLPHAWGNDLSAGGSQSGDHVLSAFSVPLRPKPHARPWRAASVHPLGSPDLKRPKCASTKCTLEYNGAFLDGAFLARDNHHWSAAEDLFADSIAEADEKRAPNCRSIHCRCWKRSIFRGPARRLRRGWHFERR
jgi:hypothetical protein